MDDLPTSALATEPIPIRLPRGTVLGRYAVDLWLREGGMAALYRGHHVATGARVAIKVQRTSDEDDATVAARFVREGEVMGRLSGVPNVVQVQDMGELPDGRRYLVLEWVEGNNLEERLDGLRNADAMLSIDDACRLLGDVARALDAAHRAAIVHRDVKPSNIMIDRGLADREVAKLLDFGISADLGAGGHGVDLTAAGVVLGTSGYVAPEQAVGLPAHPAFDVYALGVVLFEAITGYVMPPDGLGPVRLPRVGSLRKGVPEVLEALVERCMSRDPSQRPASAAEVAEVLEAVRSQRAAERSMAAAVVEMASGSSTAAGAVAERSTTAGAAERSTVAATVTRSPWPWVGLLVLVVALVGGLAWWGWGSSHGRTDVVEGVGQGTNTVASAAQAGYEADEAPASEAEAGGVAGATETDLVETGHEVGATAGSTGPGVDDESSGTAGTSGPAETGASDSGLTPASTPSRAHCPRAREDAHAALGRRDWPSVIRTTTDRACWSTADQRLDRKAMRVKAWLELRRYDRCVTEGKGETEPRVAKLTKHCRERLAEGGG
ncbi:serine/threonine-protein kinase [Paraliomyxa miuraensis]|uniref:serine/threonine-protein kinase n=1 Tax=Paraliomyxa miuraensis TaxID=376150 RepID=UPI00224F1EFC|nr:serine/threonine-protein kinase [Paraliomyxa miuraensis]MCX4247131.1 protein kinase [Paraliomyxa miuraensis]